MPTSEVSGRRDLFPWKVEALGYLYMQSEPTPCHAIYVKIRVEKRKNQGLKLLFGGQGFESQIPKLILGPKEKVRRGGWFKIFAPH